MCSVIDIYELIYVRDHTLYSVDQTLLLSKLINSGLNCSMLATIKPLSNRKGRFQVNQYIDMSLVPFIGLSQGAVLSPLLFIFYLKSFL